MNIRRNFEAVFLAAVAFVTITAYATAGVPTHHAVANVQLRHGQPSTDIVVVTVSHKRLSAAEKKAVQ
jgi:hypothetical protein